MMMLSEKNRACLQTKGVVIGRILIGGMFFVSGLKMLIGGSGPTGVAAYFASVGIPFASLTVWLVIALKLFAGGAIIIGRHVGMAALALIPFTILATYFGHSDFSNPSDVNAAIKNVALVGALLYVAAFGAGRWR